MQLLALLLCDDPWCVCGFAMLVLRVHSYSRFFPHACGSAHVIFSSLCGEHSFCVYIALVGEVGGEIKVHPWLFAFRHGTCMAKYFALMFTALFIATSTAAFVSWQRVEATHCECIALFEANGECLLTCLPRCFSSRRKWRFISGPCLLTRQFSVVKESDPCHHTLQSLIGARSNKPFQPL